MITSQPYTLSTDDDKKPKTGDFPFKYSRINFLIFIIILFLCGCLCVYITIQ